MSTWHSVFIKKYTRIPGLGTLIPVTLGHCFLFSLFNSIYKLEGGKKEASSYMDFYVPLIALQCDYMEAAKELAGWRLRLNKWHLGRLMNKKADVVIAKLNDHIKHYYENVPGIIDKSNGLSITKSEGVPYLLSIIHQARCLYGIKPSKIETELFNVPIDTVLWDLTTDAHIHGRIEIDPFSHSDNAGFVDALKGLTEDMSVEEINKRLGGKNG